MQDIPPDEEGIADGSPLRQLMPYHDLSSASETYIKRRRQKLLEIRKRRLGVDYDFEEEESHGIFCQGILQRGAVSDDVPPTRAQEGIPVPFNLSAMPTTRTNGDDEDGVRTGTIDSSQVDNAGTSEVISRKSSRKTTVTMVFSSKKSSEQFPTKLHRMLEEVDPSVAGWRPHGRAFLVKMKSEFINDVLPRYGFKQTKISSFHRQLNLYGFSRIVEGPDAGSYYHVRTFSTVCIKWSCCISMLHPIPSPAGSYLAVPPFDSYSCIDSEGILLKLFLIPHTLSHLSSSITGVLLTGHANSNRGDGESNGQRGRKASKAISCCHGPP
mmetsp:Transcript_38476/g.83585  ORF Transcript_38476/g.83585 Transcript_38476/m.83585 type:complete len:326 (-) Transcript_38476:530-1507(-)